MNDETNNNNNVSGNTFYGPTNIVAGNNNYLSDSKVKNAEYEVEPLWRSPITMAILTWLSFILPILDAVSFYKIFENALNLIKLFARKGAESNTVGLYFVSFMILSLLWIAVVCLKRIAKKQTRHPILFNYAISGLDGKITIEKIKPKSCPICGGEMKYYNKLVGEHTAKIPVLECKRNPKHCFEMDPTDL